jgi:hypothetical protein
MNNRKRQQSVLLVPASFDDLGGDEADAQDAPPQEAPVQPTPAPQRMGTASNPAFADPSVPQRLGAFHTTSRFFFFFSVPLFRHPSFFASVSDCWC